MNKPIRKGVSTYLINENKIVVIRYLPPKKIWIITIFLEEKLKRMKLMLMQQ